MHVNKVLCIVLLFACLEGCSTVSPAARIAEVEHPAPPLQQIAVRVDQTGNQLPIDDNAPHRASSETKDQTPKTDMDLTGLQAGGIDSSKIEHSALADKLNASPKAQPYASVEYLNATTSSAGH